MSDDIIPNKVCLIPDLIKTLPYKPFACSAIDALVHATEPFLSPHRKTMTSELFSEKAMDMILKGFKLIDEKGQDARFEYLDEFVTASFYAGIAFLKAGCGPVHGMSFPLGGGHVDEIGLAFSPFLVQELVYRLISGGLILFLN